MLEIVNLFRDKGVLDELGFGSIRDAFSDRFFPGISTLQTRARYFLFIPWVYRRVEREKVPVTGVDSRARQYQAIIAKSLVQGGEGDAQGVIGIQAGEALLRPPAEMYWTGLRRYRIWRYSGSISQYYRAAERAGQPVRSDDGELVEQVGVRGWDPGLPSEPADLFESATFAFTREEADYLRERVVTETKGTLLALCIESNRTLDKIDVPWLHPDVASFPEQIRRDFDHAHRFATVSYGAALVYNLMLAESAAAVLLPVAEGLTDRYRAQLADWADGVEAERELFRKWRMSDFWETVVGNGHQVGSATRAFAESIAGWSLADPRALPDNDEARQAIRQRELSLKGGLAKLTHRRALERFGGSAGLYRQTYRWGKREANGRGHPQGPATGARAQRCLSRRAASSCSSPSVHRSDSNSIMPWARRTRLTFCRFSPPLSGLRCSTGSPRTAVSSPIPSRFWRLYAGTPRTRCPLPRPSEMSDSSSNVPISTARGTGNASGRATEQSRMMLDRPATWAPPPTSSR